MGTLRTAGITVVAVLLFLGSQPAARAQNDAYMSTGSDQFGIIDLNTGVFTQLGNSGQLLSGLGAAGGNLYGGLDASNVLYQVNLTNGSLTEIGTGSINYADTGSTTSGLYAVNVGQTDLYSVNPHTGATTLIGPTGFAGPFGLIGMSTGSSTLYFTGDGNLYSLNTTTGAATLIGTQGFDVGALVTEDGELWAGANPLNEVFTLDPANADPTFVANVSGDYGSFWGLAPLPLTTTPEPTTTSLLLLGLGALVTFRRKLLS
jgi:hypothetical protein